MDKNPDKPRRDLRCGQGGRAEGRTLSSTKTINDRVICFKHDPQGVRKDAFVVRRQCDIRLLPVLYERQAP